MKNNFIVISIFPIVFALYSYDVEEEDISAFHAPVKIEVCKTNEAIIDIFINAVINYPSEIYIYSVQIRDADSRNCDTSKEEDLEHFGNFLYEDVIVIGKKNDFRINTTTGSEQQVWVNVSKITRVRKDNSATRKNVHIYQIVENPKIETVVRISYGSY